MNKIELEKSDLEWAVTRLPKALKELLMEDEWAGRVFVGGGYLRAIVANEEISDVDLFTGSKETAELLAYKLAEKKEDVYATDNAFTVKGHKLPIQIIHRWVFDDAEGVIDSFDFTVCAAAFYYAPSGGTWTEGWKSYAHGRFYIDLAAKRLVYQQPKRNEDAGGSMLRILKYYQKGYRIPLDSLGKVMARMVKELRFDEIYRDDESEYEDRIATLLTAMLVEVDPAIDPGHLAHLPSLTDEK
jgi:hypothetical protein